MQPQIVRDLLCHSSLFRPTDSQRRRCAILAARRSGRKPRSRHGTRPTSATHIDAILSLGRGRRIDSVSPPDADPRGRRYEHRRAPVTWCSSSRPGTDRSVSGECANHPVPRTVTSRTIRIFDKNRTRRGTLKRAATRRALVPGYQVCAAATVTCHCRKNPSRPNSQCREAFLVINPGRLSRGIVHLRGYVRYIEVAFSRRSGLFARTHAEPNNQDSGTPTVPLVPSVALVAFAIPPFSRTRWLPGAASLGT